MRQNFKLLLCLIFTMMCSWTYAATECAQVKFNHKKIVCLTKGVDKLNASERAHIVELRLREISHNPMLDPKKIRFEDIGENVLSVSLDDYFILSLRPTDFVYPEDIDYKVAANSIVENIREAIHSDRETRAPESIIRGGIYTAVATIVLFLTLFAFSKAFPHIYTILNVHGKRLPSIKIQKWEVVKSEHVVRLLIWFVQIIRGILTIITLYIYIPMVLSFFPQTANLAPQILNFIMEPIKHMFQGIIDFIPNMFFILLISVVTYYCLKIVKFFFDEVERENIKFEGFYKEWARPSYMLFRVVIIAFAVVMAFPYIPGSSSPAFRGVSVFLGILLSLGSTSAIANIIAGVVLTYMRPFHVGDIVKIADTVGRVTDKNLLVTRIRSIKNVEITIPNSMVLGSHMINYSSTVDEQGLILHTTVTFGYDVPWTRVHELLKLVASKTSLIESRPEPFILQTALDEFYVHYELNVYTKQPSKMAIILSELHQNIQDVFHENGLELIVPHYTSVRDGNETTLPKDYREPGYKTPGFKVVSER